MTATAARLAVAAAEAAVGLTPVTFMSFEAVEIAHVGMEWPASTGPVTLTFQHLADAVDAENNDPHILSPRLKIGHEDPRFNEDPPIHDAFHYHGPLRDDGNPVYGKAQNLRLAEDGMVLIGDYAEVPEWLGNSLPSAYPNRSLEGDWNITTEGGKKYSFVITAVALLGEPLPAISCLEDLVRELTGGPNAVREQTPITLNKEDPMPPVSAEASTDSVREQFWGDFAQDEYYWWWPLEIRLDEGRMLADDDEGHLYQVPFTIDADGIVAWGVPVPGVLDFRPVAAGKAPAPVDGYARFGTPVAAGRPKDRVRAGSANNEGSNDVDISTLREQLEMPDATDDEVIAAAAERLTTTPPAEVVDEPAVEDVPEPVAANVKTATVDKARLEKLEQDAELGVKAHQTQLAAEADKLVGDAKLDGRIAPASASAWRSSILPDDATELVDTEVKALASLAKGRIPLLQRGIVPAVDAAQDEGRRARVHAALGLTKTKETN